MGYEYMNSGNLVLATSKSSFISKCIRWFTQSQFSHSFVTMPDVLGFPMCIEAAEGGVDYMRFDAEYSSNQDSSYEVWNIKISQSVKDAAMQSILNDLETNYGFLEYPWFMWRKLNSLFGRDIKSQNNWNTDGMICSQLCVAYLTACGLSNIFAGYGKGSVAPQDLSVIFHAHPELFELIQSVRM
jgi:hypothetical protein